MSGEVENVNSMTSGGGGSTSATPTLTSELRQSTENAVLTGADAVSAQTLTTLSTGDFCGALKKCSRTRVLGTVGEVIIIFITN